MKHGGGNQNDKIYQKIKTAAENGNILQVINNNGPNGNKKNQVSKPNGNGFLYIENKHGEIEKGEGAGTNFAGAGTMFVLLVGGTIGVHLALSSM